MYFMQNKINIKKKEIKRKDKEKETVQLKKEFNTI